MKISDLSYRYINLNDIFTKASEMLKKQGIVINDSIVENIFRFQYEELKNQMKQKEYIILPDIGSFGIQIWKDLLEEERLLFCVKNQKGDFTKKVYKLNNTIINHNWIYYNKARAEHSTYNDVDIYKKEISILFDKYKDYIITRELLVDAYIKENKASKDKISSLLDSTKDISEKWFINKIDRKRKIDYHNIEGFESYRDKKIKENKLI